MTEQDAMREAERLLRDEAFRGVIKVAAPTAFELVRFVNRWHDDDALVACAALSIATKVVVTFAMMAHGMSDERRAALNEQLEQLVRFIGAQLHVVEGGPDCCIFEPSEKPEA